MRGVHGAVCGARARILEFHPPRFAWRQGGNLAQDKHLEFYHARRPRVGRYFCMACCFLFFPAHPAYWTVTFIHASREPCTPCRSHDLHRGWLPCRSTASAQGVLQLCPNGVAIPKNALVVESSVLAASFLEHARDCKTLSIVKLKL